jgi:hypothetical protein
MTIRFAAHDDAAACARILRLSFDDLDNIERLLFPLVRMIDIMASVATLRRKQFDKTLATRRRTG